MSFGLEDQKPRHHSRGDEAIQFPHAELDCFAELVIGPATSGRTRWLAMTAEDGTEFQRHICGKRDARNAGRAPAFTWQGNAKTKTRSE